MRSSHRIKLRYDFTRTIFSVCFLTSLLLKTLLVQDNYSGVITAEFILTQT